jgi:4-amino-4-deoxy-L-arabinose transferase-like glycosyltransferase
MTLKDGRFAVEYKQSASCGFIAILVDVPLAAVAVPAVVPCCARARQADGKPRMGSSILKSIMAAVSIPAPPREATVRFAYAELLGVLAICVFVIAFGMLRQQPVVALDRASGLYREEGSPARFRWTSSLAEFSLMSHTGPTELTLDLSMAGWPRQPDVPVQFETDTGPIGTVVVAAPTRHIQMLLPPRATFLRLRTSVARPDDDWRWLGVQVLSISARPTGLPFGATIQALLLSIASIVLALALAVASRSGYGTIAILTLVGLGLRLFWITYTPPLMHRDELVSLVDAWNLANTGHDHLGHILPIAAFEAYGDWVSPMLTYLLLPWVALFGPQPIVARIVTAAFGTLAIPAIYGLVRELRMPAAAICAALVTALSPWQIFLSRVAIPPALVATTWTLCLWAALRYVHFGRRRDALWLAAAAGLSLYAYPTMKMAVPLLVVLAIALALPRYGWRAAARCWLPALMLGALWLPFLASTLLSPITEARLQLVGLRAATPGEWLIYWWRNYIVYFQPDLYYISGGIRKIVQGLPDRGLALSVEAIPLLGALALPALKLARRDRAFEAPEHSASSAIPISVWLLLLGALLIAPLPASLTTGNPHAFRASPLAPLYALFVGVGAATEWAMLGLLPKRARMIARGLGTVTLGIVLAWQCSTWFTDLLQNYPRKADATWFFADREFETMQYVASYASHYGEVWIDTSTVGRPYIFLLAAQAMPPAEAQASLVVLRQPPAINTVTQLGRYHFGDFGGLGIPQNLAVLEALPTSDGGPGYLIQEWRRGDQRVLVVRGMTTHIENFSDDETLDTGGDT